jgi:hypothetical protein
MNDQTSTKEQITAGIEEWVSRGHGAMKEGRGDHEWWYIGITNDQDERKIVHKAEGYSIDENDWHCWKAESLKDAQHIETYYQNEKPGKKMQGHVGGNLKSSPVFVYIFFAGKKRTLRSLLDGL